MAPSQHENNPVSIVSYLFFFWVSFFLSFFLGTTKRTHFLVIKGTVFKKKIQKGIAWTGHLLLSKVLCNFPVFFSCTAFRFGAFMFDSCAYFFSLRALNNRVYFYLYKGHTFFMMERILGWPLSIVFSAKLAFASSSHNQVLAFICIDLLRISVVYPF